MRSRSAAMNDSQPLRRRRRRRRGRGKASSNACNSMYLFHDVISICASNNSSVPPLHLFQYIYLVALAISWRGCIAISSHFPTRSTSMTSESATVIQMDDGRAPAVAAPAAGGAAASSSYATAPTSSSAAEPAAAPRKTSTGGGGLPFLLRSGAEGFRRCLAVIDFLLRVAAFGPTLAAAISTGTADERLSVFTNFFQFHARFDDFPAFTFFLVANAVAAGYLVLSLPFSVVGILRPSKATGVRLLLLLCDVVIMALLTAAGAAAAAIVYVAHSGNRRANWVPICMQFHGFCQRTSGSVVATFLAVLVFIVLILMAACAIRRRPS